MPMIRDEIKSQLTTAMKARDAGTVATLRLVQSALKNRDIELRTAAAPADDDVVVIDVLTKMAKQRRESIVMYDQGNRPELAAAERAELGLIESFLPKQLAADDAAAAVRALVAELGAAGPADMGRVMAAVKARLAGQIDMKAASSLVKAALG